MTKYTTVLQIAIFENGLTIQSGWIQVFNFDNQCEYTGTSNEFIQIGVGLPANSCLDEPEIPTDPTLAIIRKNDEWLHVKDHRGLTAFDKETRQQTTVNTIELADNLTLLKPSDFDRWDGKKWVLDTQAKKAYDVQQNEAKKTQLINEVSQEIAMLQDAVDVELATDEEITRLATLKKYRVLLNRVDTSLEEIELPQI